MRTDTPARREHLEHDMRRALQALCEHPRGDDARALAEGACAALGMAAAAECLRRDYPVLLRDGTLYVATGPSGRVLTVGAIHPDDTPGCGHCGEITAALDDVGGVWCCQECLGREYPW